MEKKQYKPGEKVKKTQEDLQNHQANKPGKYESQWAGSAEGVLNDMKNRPDFSYDAGKDPLYRQAMTHSVRLGRKAMMDTMGKAAALTGGYGNSYAQGAGQQAYGEYLQALADKLPTFADRAFRQYESKGKDLKDLYGLYQGRDQQDYGRYQDAVKEYLAREEQLLKAYDRESDRDYHRFDRDRDYEYHLDRDQREDQLDADRRQAEQSRWEQELQYQKDRDKEIQSRWEQEFNEDRRRFELKWAQEHAPSNGGGGGGYRGPSTDIRKHQAKHSLTESEYEKKKKWAQQSGHYSPRPSGKPWRPSTSPSKPNFHKKDFTW